MRENDKINFLILGFFIFLGLSSLGYLLSNAFLEYRQYERSIKVKGLSEKEFPADIVIWPIQFSVASNDLENLYNAIDNNNIKIKEFLLKSGVTKSEISISSPSIIDKSANQYGNDKKPEFRYRATAIATVYSKNIEKVREVQNSLSTLGKQGIVFIGSNYANKTEYLFTKLNEIKPQMIQEATKKAREVAEKFALDSDSKLGKIKKASQGQFTISQRDKNNPHIKKVRVVSTIEYYLSD